MDLKKCWGVEKCLGGMPTNFVYGFEKKCWGGGLCPNILYFKNVSGGGGGGMPTNFMDLKKLLRGEGYAQIFHRLENC